MQMRYSIHDMIHRSRWTCNHDDSQEQVRSDHLIGSRSHRRVMHRCRDTPRLPKIPIPHADRNLVASCFRVQFRVGNHALPESAWRAIDLCQPCARLSVDICHVSSNLRAGHITQHQPSRNIPAYSLPKPFLSSGCGATQDLGSAQRVLYEDRTGSLREGTKSGSQALNDRVQPT
jgi:hypothetical protein